MRVKSLRVAWMLLVLGLLSAVSAENLLVMKFGMAWPSAAWVDTLPSQAGSEFKRTSYGVSAHYGYLFDWRVGLGLGGDFQWNRYVDEETDVGDMRYVAYYRKDYMFPFYGVLIIDPIPKFMFHPAIRGEIGYNSLVYVESDDSGYVTRAAAKENRAVSGYYLGLFARLALDANLDFSESVGAVLTGSYQFAKTRSAKTYDQGRYRTRDMSGWGIQFGLRFFF